MGNFQSEDVFKLTVIRLVLITLFVFFIADANAQIGRGCYVDGVLYTANTSKGNRFFYRSPGNLSDPCGYEYTGSNDGQCRLYNSGPEGNNSSYTSYPTSFGNDWAVIACPIDDYVWILLVVIGGLVSNKFYTLVHATKR
ncbi:MAG: hypothetical protein ACQUHE_12465 [Bacteroidia bacterium]